MKIFHWFLMFPNNLLKMRAKDNCLSSTSSKYVLLNLFFNFSYVFIYLDSYQTFNGQSIILKFFLLQVIPIMPNENLIFPIYVQIHTYSHKRVWSERKFCQDSGPYEIYSQKYLYNLFSTSTHIRRKSITLLSPLNCIYLYS